MTLRFKIYTRKPQPIRVLEITEENADEVCEMLGGSFQEPQYSFAHGENVRLIAWGWEDGSDDLCEGDYCDCGGCEGEGYFRYFVSVGQFLSPRDDGEYTVYSSVMLGQYECLDEGAIGGLVDATIE